MAWITMSEDNDKQVENKCNLHHKALIFPTQYPKLEWKIITWKWPLYTIRLNLTLKREIQIKTTLSYHFSLIRLANIQKFYKLFCGDHLGKEAPVYIAGQSRNGLGNMEYIETKKGTTRKQLAIFRVQNVLQDSFFQWIDNTIFFFRICGVEN